MKRLMENTVLSGLVTAWRLTTWPPMRSPDLGFTATTEGVMRLPSAFSSTVGSPPSITATTEFVVPRSIPITFAIVTLTSQGMLRGAPGLPLPAQRAVDARGVTLERPHAGCERGRAATCPTCYGNRTIRPV